jgi:hypothetical protein
MSAKVLIFECNKLLTVLELHRALEPMGVEVQPVPRKHYNKSLEDILDPWSEIYDDDSELEDYTGQPLGGQMAVLCELEDKLDDVLLALRSAGFGFETLKAVLTPTNAEWEPVQLYKELQRERDEFRKMNK